MPGVVLVHDRAPPLDHLLLDGDRARRRGVDHHLQRGEVVPRAHLLGQLEHAHEHRRHDLGVGHLVALDEGQELLRIEVLHDHRGAADPLDGHVEAQRSRVVQRRGREVHHPVAEPEQHRAQGQQGRVGAERHVGDRSLHALGPAGGARRVEHVGSLAPVGQRLGREAGDGFLVGLVAVDHAVEHQAEPHVGRRRQDLGGLVGLVARGHEDLGAAVVDDVLELGRLQP